MNLSELNDGVPETKGWLNPVVSNLTSNTITTNNLEIGDIATTGYSLPVTTGTPGQILHVDSAGDLEFINLSAETKPFIGIASVTVANSIAELPSIPTGVGSLTVPSFSVGDSFTLHTNGILSCLNNSILTMRLYANATLLITCTLPGIGATTAKGFSNEIHMTLRNLAGDFQINTEFHSLTDSGGNSLYSNIVSALTNVDISVPNTLSMTLQWGFLSATNTITTSTFILAKD